MDNIYPKLPMTKGLVTCYGRHGMMPDKPTLPNNDEYKYEKMSVPNTPYFRAQELK